MSDFTFVRTVVIAKIRTLIGVGHLNDVIWRGFLCFVFEFLDFGV